ncbi:MAG: alpha/beta hydrolase [Kosmotoga sp.]|nr:MAG: alpha/beta hydrolase [Kosmotoga sp.]
MKVFLQALCYGALTIGLFISFSLGYSAYIADSGEKSDILQDVKYIKVNGEKIAYREAGEENSEVLVLIHGFLGSSYDYSRIIPSLAERYHIIAPDLIGFGFSTKNEKLDYSKKSLSEFVYLTLIELNIYKFNVLGHSMGGEVALNLVLTHPESVSKLILIDSGGYLQNERRLPSNEFIGSLYLRTVFQNYLLQRSIFKLAFYDREVVQISGFKPAYSMVYNIPSKTLYKFNSDDDSGSITEKIKTIKTPTLIMWGDKDQLIDVKYAKIFNEDLLDSQLVIIKDSGHIPHIEKPNETLKAIYEFLD